MGFITVKEAGRRLRVKTFTIRGWIRQLKDSDPITYNSYIQTHIHKWNKNLEIYTVEEDFIKELQKRFSTHSFTYSFTHPDIPQGAGTEARPGGQKSTDKNTRKETINPDIFNTVITTLNKELEAQRDTLNRILQDHAKERERADILIMQLRGDVKGLNEKLFLLTEGKQQEKETPPETPGEVVDKQAQEKAPETQEKQEEITFTFSERVWLLGQDLKRILNKKIF